MNLSSLRSRGARALALAVVAMLSTVTLAMPLTWQFGGSYDHTPFSALVVFDSLQVAEPYTITTQIGTLTTSPFDIESLDLSLAGLNPITTTRASILQTTLESFGTDVLTYTYTISATFGVLSSTISSAGYINAITMSIPINLEMGTEFVGLLTDVNLLQANLPGTFEILADGIVHDGLVTTVSDVTGIPEPWTLGLMGTGLGSMALLSLFRFQTRKRHRDED